MVSLNPENGGQSRSGGFPFDEWSQSVHETEDLLTGPYQQNPEIHRFRPLCTPWSIILLVIFTLGLETCLFVIPAECTDGRCGPSAHSLLLYIHGSMWFLFMLADRYWRAEHYKSRTSGYLEFYRQTRHIRRTPLLVFSGGTAFLLIVSVVFSNHCDPGRPDDTDWCPGPFTKSSYLQILVSIENAAILPALLLYLVKTIKFNRLQPDPDIDQDEAMSSLSRSRSQNLGNSIGFRDETFVDEILEKQADMIRYLKHHNTHLGRKILQLTAQLDHTPS